MKGEMIMPRVHHVKKARKDHPQYGIKKGESYYWWKFRFGGKQVSKTHPKRSQLTQSSFLSQLWDIEDGISERFVGLDSSEDIELAKEELLENIEELKDECQESLNNMPYHLQDTSDAGTTLQERIDGLDGWVDELNSIDMNNEDLESLIEEITNTSSNL